MKCSDLIDDDITDDMKCVKNILLYQGLDAWKLTKSHCRSESKAIMDQCFANDWESSMSRKIEQTTTASSKTPENVKENFNESTLIEDGTLVVELVDLMIESIKSFDVEKCHHKDRPIINLTFNINGKDIKKIKIVGEKYAS